jgi:hypothetical protein
MAQAMGLSHMTISRIWRAFGLKPHRTETFKLSPDPWLIEKVRDIVGLYLTPPEHAVVFCVDVKPQIQALDRTAPLLPLQPGQVARRTHDYTRHGTTSLYAALNVQSGEVTGRTFSRQRAREWRAFLNERASRSTSFSTTPAPTRARSSVAGSRAIPASTSTTRRPMPRG